MVEFLRRLENCFRAGRSRVTRREGAARRQVRRGAVCLHRAEGVLTAVQRLGVFCGGCVAVEAHAVFEF